MKISVDFSRPSLLSKLTFALLCVISLMKPLQQYFHTVLSIITQFHLQSLWMKSYGVTIQMKVLQQCFHMVLFIQYLVLTFESVDEILWCYHSNESTLAVLSHQVLFIQYLVPTFESVDEILWCYHSNESTLAVLSHGTIYIVFSSSF